MIATDKKKNNRPRYYIGIATTFHDPAIAIVNPNGEVIFAEAVERHLQDKRALDQRADHFVHLPEILRTYCDPEADLVVATTWSRRFSFFLSLGMAFQQFAFPVLKRYSTALNRSLLPEFQIMTFASLICNAQKRAGLGVLSSAYEAFGHRRVRLERYEHHLTHAAHACLTSPFENAICVVVDGMGELSSLAVYHYRLGTIRQLTHHKGIESLGLFYSAITELCGFRSSLDEQWKVMGLAAYGRRDQEFETLLRRLCHVQSGRIRIPSRREVRRITNAISRMVGSADRDSLRVADLARAGQTIFTENMTALLRPIAERCLSENLVLTGGCALNSAYNGRVLQETGFRNLYVPAAPADDGNAVGAALLAQRRRAGPQIWHPGQHGQLYPYVGSGFSQETLRRVKSMGLPGRVRQISNGLVEDISLLLAAGRVVGWLQGRAEFGPRALGNRSILADPRDSKMKDRLNHQIKFREDFRPFAPAILHEEGPNFFENYQFTPYMERALHFHPKQAERVPAVVHVDGTGRLQSVTKYGNPRFYALIEAFAKRTGIPLLLNTSCNVIDKPMVHAVEDALGLFFTSGMDVLIIDDFVIEK